IIDRFWLPLVDAALSYAGFLLINPTWEAVKFPDGGHHPQVFLLFFVPAYIFIWLVSIYFSGGYDRPVKPGKIFRGTIYGTAIILVFYSLLPEAYRFSRALILLGSVWTLVEILMSRFLLHLAHVSGYRLDIGTRKKLVIVGTPDEAERISNLIDQTSQPVDVYGFVSPDPNVTENGKYLGSVNQISDIIRINHIDEVIFCAKDISTNEIIKYMLALSSLETEYKIAPEEAESIIGSNSANTAGDLYVIPINSVGEPHNRRMKRVFDVFVSLILLIFFPVSIWFFLPRPWMMLLNSLQVLIGSRSWVGYAQSGIHPGYNLPPLKKGILNPENGSQTKEYDSHDWLNLNLHYARDYKLMKDIRILFKDFRHIVRRTKPVILLALMLCALIPGGWSQDFRDQINLIRPVPDNCLVYGTITVRNTELLTGVRVSLTDPQTYEVSDSLITDRNGWYLFSVKKGSPYGLIIEKSGFFPYYVQDTIPAGITETKLEQNISLPGDLRKDFALYYPNADTVMGGKSRDLLEQLTGLLKKHPDMAVWLDPKGDSSDFTRINRITSVFVNSGVELSRILTGSQPNSSETYIRLEIRVGTEKAVTLPVTAATLPDDNRWTIQIAASKTPLGPKSLKGLDPVFDFKGKDGYHRYCFGSFDSKNEANRNLPGLKKRGFTKPMVKTVKSMKKM
ncbi:MAG: hypothetical protein PHY99_05365, partial [Bacteroidales bacterium]|nr:hypothetical protein [Bacteroidales bacterium]